MVTPHIPTIVKDPKLETWYFKNKYPSDFSQNIDYDHIHNLEKILSEKCINKKSIRHKCEVQYIDGFKVFVYPKGKHLFKMMNGFLTEEKLKSLSDNNGESLLWYGSQYTAYLLAQFGWRGVNSYKTTDNIYLLDIFCKENLDLIFKYVKDSDLDDKLKEKILNHLKLSTGYGYNKEEYYQKLAKQSQWDDIWEFTKPTLMEYTTRYCDDLEEIPGLNPVSRYKQIYALDLISLLHIINNITKLPLDGILRSQIRSTIEQGGLYAEEIIVSSKVWSNKLVRDEAHPIDWTNWYNKIKGFKPPINFRMSEGDPYWHKMKFYLNNKYKKQYIKRNNKSFIVMNLNVHSFKNFNDDIDKCQNQKLIINLIRDINPDLLFLEEVKLLPKCTVFSDLSKLGFRDIKRMSNGAPSDSSLILVCSKNRMDKFHIVDLKPTGFKKNRQVGVATIKGFKFVAVHLEIGDSHHGLYYPEDVEKKIIEDNKKTRIEQLEKLLNSEQNIDVIMGDFNFTLSDPESHFLRKEKGFNLIDDRAPTVPYGTRVDLTFINSQSKIKHGKNYTVSANYSDHLPVIQEFFL
jgi:exonuclease III